MLETLLPALCKPAKDFSHIVAAKGPSFLWLPNAIVLHANFQKHLSVYLKKNNNLKK